MTRARALAARHPASCACWDLVQHPDPAISDTRTLPYTERRARLLELLAEGGPPLQPVPATDDRDRAEHWYKALQTQGLEGVVAKQGAAAYPSGRRGWVKVRHADTADGLVVEFTGPRLRPQHLALVVGDEDSRVRLSACLEPVLAAHVGADLTDAEVIRDRRTEGETCTRIQTALTVGVSWRDRARTERSRWCGCGDSSQIGRAHV